MSKISEISNNALPVLRSAAPPPEKAEGFADVFSEALAKTVDSDVAVTTDSSVSNSPDIPVITSNAASSGSVFVETTDDILARTMQDSLVNNMLTSTTSSGSAMQLSSGMGVEGMMLASAANGEIDENQLAMFMLYMMMNSLGEDSEMSMLYGVMSTLLTSMTDGAAIKTDAVGDAPGVTVPTVVGWDTSEYTGGDGITGVPMAPIYTGPIKSAVTPEISPDGAILPMAYWKTTTPAIVGSEDNRSAENLRAIIDQFDVENSGRYKPRDGYTYCNIFLWDVTSALGCEIPHYVNADTGEPMTYPDVTGSMELNSNRTLDWLVTKGVEYGWREVTPEEAQNAANQGLPAVTVWKNPGDVGHVQVVCPSEDGLYDAERGPTIAQAGRKTLNYAYSRSVYSVNGLSKVRYFAHD